jgi:hypothetical protein
MTTELLQGEVEIEQVRCCVIRRNALFKIMWKQLNAVSITRFLKE